MGNRWSMGARRRTGYDSDVADRQRRRRPSERSATAAGGSSLEHVGLDHVHGAHVFVDEQQYFFLDEHRPVILVFDVPEARRRLLLRPPPMWPGPRGRSRPEGASSSSTIDQMRWCLAPPPPPPDSQRTSRSRVRQKWTSSSRATPRSIESGPGGRTAIWRWRRSQTSTSRRGGPGRFAPPGAAPPGARSASRPVRDGTSPGGGTPIWR